MQHQYNTACHWACCTMQDVVVIDQHCSMCYACSAGLLLSSLALHMAAPAQRLIPEALTFASTLLATAAPTPATAAAQGQQWLLPAGGWSGLASTTPALSLAQVLHSSSEDATLVADSFRGSLLQAALAVVHRAADVFAQLASFPELFASAVGTLSALRHTKGLPEVCQNPQFGIMSTHIVLHHCLIVLCS